MVDQLNLDPLAIEANLAHAVKDANGRSYNLTQYLAQRFDQIQQWADYLDAQLLRPRLRRCQPPQNWQRHSSTP